MAKDKSNPVAGEQVANPAADARTEPPAEPRESAVLAGLFVLLEREAADHRARMRERRELNLPLVERVALEAVASGPSPWEPAADPLEPILQSIISPYARPAEPDGRGLTLDLGDGPRRWRIPKSAPWNVTTAIRTLRRLNDRLWARQLRFVFNLGRLMDEDLLTPTAEIGQRKQESAAKARLELKSKRAKHRAWVCARYQAFLADNPRDTALARRLVRKAFSIEFPNDKPPKISTIATWVRESSKKPAK